MIFWMSSKTTYFQYSAARLSHQVSRIRWLTSILAWFGLLMVVKPFTSTQFLTRLALSTDRSGSQHNPSYDSVPVLLCWFNTARWLNRRNCLVRALVTCRVFRLVGEEPTLIIGTDGQTGHAWVEIDDQVMCESPDSIRLFRPVFIVKSNSHQIEVADRQ